MPGVIVHQLPALTDNYIYLIHDPDSGATAAVDPGAADPVMAALADRGWRLTHILNTHHHQDHTGGNLALKRATGAQVVGAGMDSGRIPGLDVQVADGHAVALGAATATVIGVPGHTSGHIAFWFAASHALFCGDTLFSLGCGRLFEGTPADMWQSLDKLRRLPPDTRVYCAHEYTAANGRFARTVEPDNDALAARMDSVARLRAAGRPTVPSLLAEECAANPFLRADLPAVAQAMGLPPGTDPVRVFAALRQRKDVF